jgi:hypothetical protein
MEKVYKFVEKYSIPIIIIVIVLTAIMGYFALQIDIEGGIKDMLPQNSPVVKRFEDASDTFGSLTYTAVMIHDDDILDQSTLKKIEAMTQDFSEAKGVSDVISLTNIKDIQGGAGGIKVNEFIDKIPETASEIESLKNQLSSKEQYVGKIFTPDFKDSMILVKFLDQVEPEVVVSRIRNIVKKYEGPEEFFLAGNPVIVADVINYMKRDLSRLLPFVIAAIIAVLYISFRSKRGVILPVLTVIISVIWALGIQQLLGKSLSMISTVLPVLLVSVGSAYAIHIVARYYEGIKEGYEKNEAVKKAIENVGIAVIMAGTTTMIGFASLFFSDLIIIQDFALGTTIGVGIALLVSIIFIPAVLINLKVTKKSRDGKELKLTQNIFKGIESLVFKYRKPLLVLVVLIILGSILVIPTIKTESNYIAYFQKGSTTRVSTNLVDERFGGSQPVDVVIEGNIKNPELLKQMRDFQEEAVKLPYINNAQSMVNIFREENMALNNTREIPTTQNQIAQYLLLLEMSDNELISNYLTFDYQNTRIQMTMEMVSSTKQKEVLGELEKLIDKYFGEEFKAEITGVPSLSLEINDLIISGQIKSLISAVLFTLVITSLLLKSIKRGFFTTLPIAFTVLVNFGLMGILNIKLDIATAMIASIAVGIGVDYSIHIFTRFIEENEKLDNPAQALKTSIQTVGRANLYNAAAVIVGFSVILLSSFPPLVSFGGLTAFTMVVSFFGALVLLPVLILSAYKMSDKKDLFDNN